MNAKKNELLALGVFGRGSRLRERLAGLLEGGREFSARASRIRVGVTAAGLLLCVAAGSVAPRVVALAQDQLKFAASSIRPAEPQPPGEQFFGMAPGPNGGLRVRDVPLRFLINFAFKEGGPNLQISGGPDWAGTERYDVVATPELAEKPPTREQLQEMTRSLLAERFKLQVHGESREIPVYALTIAKGGSKLRREWPAPSPDPQGTLCDANRKPMCTYVMEKAPLATLVAFLGRMDRPVVDRTGLEGEFDFRLKYDPRCADDEPGCVPLRDAIEDQLGLKLEESKAPVEVLVIDHAEKPDPN